MKLTCDINRMMAKTQVGQDDKCNNQVKGYARQNKTRVLIACCHYCHFKYDLVLERIWEGKTPELDAEYEIQQVMES